MQGVQVPFSAVLALSCTSYFLQAHRPHQHNYGESLELALVISSQESNDSEADARAEDSEDSTKILSRFVI